MARCCCRRFPLPMCASVLRRYFPGCLCWYGPAWSTKIGWVLGSLFWPVANGLALVSGGVPNLVHWCRYQAWFLFLGAAVGGSVVGQSNPVRLVRLSVGVSRPGVSLLFVWPKVVVVVFSDFGNAEGAQTYRSGCAVLSSPSRQGACVAQVRCHGDSPHWANGPVGAWD